MCYEGPESFSWRQFQNDILIPPPCTEGVIFIRSPSVGATQYGGAPYGYALAYIWTEAGTRYIHVDDPAFGFMLPPPAWPPWNLSTFWMSLGDLEYRHYTGMVGGTGIHDASGEHGSGGVF